MLQYARVSWLCSRKNSIRERTLQMYTLHSMPVGAYRAAGGLIELFQALLHIGFYTQVNVSSVFGRGLRVNTTYSSRFAAAKPVDVNWKQFLDVCNVYPPYTKLRYHSYVPAPALQKTEHVGIDPANLCRHAARYDWTNRVGVYLKYSSIVLFWREIGQRLAKKMFCRSWARMYLDPPSVSACVRLHGILNVNTSKRPKELQKLR